MQAALGKVGASAKYTDNASNAGYTGQGQSKCTKCLTHQTRSVQVQNMIDTTQAALGMVSASAKYGS